MCVISGSNHSDRDTDAKEEDQNVFRSRGVHFACLALCEVGDAVFVAVCRLLSLFRRVGVSRLLTAGKLLYMVICIPCQRSSLGASLPRWSMPKSGTRTIPASTARA